MPQHHHHNNGFLARLPEKVFRLTGVHLRTLIKFGVVLLIAIAGIGWVLLNTSAERAERTKRAEKDFEVAVHQPKQLTNKEKLREASKLPHNFSEKLPVERIDILNAKIEHAEELAQSDDDYRDRAAIQLVFLYAARCEIEELEGLDSENTYRRLAQLRQEALAAGNEERVATVDFSRASAATSRLTVSAERADFRFASDAILSLDSNLLKFSAAQKLYVDAVNIHGSSTDKDSALIYLSLIAGKLIDSPNSAISDLGLNLIDYPKYVQFLNSIDSQTFATRELKEKLYGELLAEIEKAPPRSPVTYRVIVQLIDRLANKSEAQTASLLIERLSKATSKIDPKIKTKVDQSIKNLEKRISILEKTLDFSGATTFDETPLSLPNGKRSTLVFWQPSDQKTVNHVVLLAESEWFDPWATNVLLACPSTLSDQQLKLAGKKFRQFKVLDNATSRKLAIGIGIDLLPYHVSLDKDNKVIRLNSPKD